MNAIEERTMQAETVPLPVLPAPGIHLDVPFSEYLRWPLLSQSTLKEGRNSMAHLKARLDGERHKAPTDDMVLGSALHTCFLEPELASQRIAVWESDGPRRGKAWDEFCLDNPGRFLLTKDMSKKLIGMVRSLRRHKCVREWLGKIEHTEVSIVGEVHGVPMKGRCDALTTDPLVDLKKVQSGDLYLFRKNALSFGYDIQAYTYSQMFDRERFMLITVEDFPPYDVVPYEFSPAMLRVGKRETIRLLEDYKRCLETKQWPGRSAEVVELEPPEYALRGSTITVGGEEV